MLLLTKSITVGHMLVILCFGTAYAHAAGPSAFSTGTSSNAPAGWRFVGLPERNQRPPTQFDIVNLDNRRVLRAVADASYGNLVYDWSGPASTVQFAWRLDAPLTKADLHFKKTEDIALKLCMSFDMPAASIPAAERNLFRLAQLFSKEKLPTATVCYVWDHALPVGTEIPSPYTHRIRYMVLNSGEEALRTWQQHQRNIGADFLKAFGTESSVVPAVLAIILGADSDNTQGKSMGYFSDITVQP